MTECDAEWNHVALRLAYMYSHADLDSMVRIAHAMTHEELSGLSFVMARMLNAFIIDRVDPGQTLEDVYGLLFEQIPPA